MAQPGAGQEPLTGSTGPVRAGGYPTYPAEQGLGFARLVSLSDGVFAIALTLLAIDVRLPELAPEQVDAGLPAAVLGLTPQFLVYALSFLIIAGFWMEHHRMFHHIERYDYQLIWTNFGLLLSVAFLPVPNNTLSRYPGEEAAALFYAASLLVTGMWQVALWRYASRGRRLVAADLDPRVVHYVTLRGVIPMATAGLAAVLAPFSPPAATFLLALLFVVAVPLGHFYYRALLRISGAPA
ncbi:MAG TPA: TMEM175 family protein [Chloroflexota bacterium]|nr:TMEM175 family protein [Chloroflexota bacterium]